MSQGLCWEFPAPPRAQGRRREAEQFPMPWLFIILCFFLLVDGDLKTQAAITQVHDATEVIRESKIEGLERHFGYVIVDVRGGFVRLYFAHTLVERDFTEDVVITHHTVNVLTGKLPRPQVEIIVRGHLHETPYEVVRGVIRRRTKNGIDA